MYTINAAYTMRQENVVGSLEPGKRNYIVEPNESRSKEMDKAFGGDVFEPIRN